MTKYTTQNTESYNEFVKLLKLLNVQTTWYLNMCLLTKDNDLNMVLS